MREDKEPLRHQGGSNKLEWTEDVLQAAAKNAKVEGDVAPADSSVAVLELSNYAQIMSKTAEISGTLEEVDKYGRDLTMSLDITGSIAA